MTDIVCQIQGPTHPVMTHDVQSHHYYLKKSFFLISHIKLPFFSFRIEMGGTQSTAAKGNGYHILRVSIKFLIYCWEI